MTGDNKELWVRCDCHSPEHLFVLEYFPNDEDFDEWGTMYMQIHLANWYGIFRRLWAALRYVFGYRCRYGEFDEVLINREKAREIRDFVNGFLGE